tara:strand:+ start:509 stop:622 length:114 start_codon:yes stop_codon:yes gene_type:complete
LAATEVAVVEVVWGVAVTVVGMAAATAAVRVHQTMGM